VAVQGSQEDYTAQTTTTHKHVRLGIGNGRGQCIHESAWNVH
jgi:hypothetical protein